MQAVWHHENPVCIHPGGKPMQGLHSVLNSWEKILSMAKTPRMEFEPLSSFIQYDLEVHVVQESITPHPESTSKASTLLATNTFLLTDAGWKMVLHHSTLPLIDVGIKEIQPRLH